MTTYTVELADGTEVRAHRGKYRHAGQAINKAPVAEVTVRDERGSIGEALALGEEVDVFRDGDSVFPGLVSTRKRITSASQESVTATLIHRGYRELQKWLCDPYVFDEDDDPYTTRDAVLVNPWRYFIFRKAGGTLDANGDEPEVDGVEVHQVARCLLGTRFITQHDYQDNTPFLPSDIYASTNKVQVYADDDQIRPFLQRVRKNASSFLAGQAIESIPLENGDPDVVPMGTISTVEVVLIGDLNASQHPTIRVCRNARAASRTYTAVTLAHTANYRSTGLSAWTGSVDLSGDGAADKNSLGYEVTVPGSDGDAATTKVHYAKLTATTTPDMALTEGTIETYDDPHTTDLADEWVEDDYQGTYRGDALERLRQGTVSDPAVSPSPHWDMWVDNDLAFHFKERRGVDTGLTYSHAESNITVLQREEYGDRLAYQTIAVGGGRGRGERVIVDKTAFSSGGLYDADRDPAGGAIYGDLPLVHVFRDQSATSPVELKRRARARHKVIRDPREHYRVAFIGFHENDFDVGDEIAVSEPDWGLSGQDLRVVNLGRSWDGESGEDLDVELGEPTTTPTASLQKQKVERERADRSPERTVTTGSIAGPPTYFDKDRYGRASFTIPEGIEIERVFLAMTTLPWQTHAKQAEASGTAEFTNQLDQVYDVGQEFDAFSAAELVEVSVIAAGEGTYDGVIVTGTIRNQSGATDTYKFRIKNVTQATTLYDESGGVSIDDDASFTINRRFTTAQVAEGDVVRFEVYDGIVGTDAASAILGYIQITVQTASTHEHELVFGIYQFDGDAGDGTGNAAYGEDVQFAVDPALNAAGEPTSFATNAHPGKFGERGASKNLVVDVTGYMRQDANGQIAPGEHLVYFKGTAQASGSPLNAQGLAVVSLTPILKIREAVGR